MERGSRLGHYEILAPIGAGGMGEVYLARDVDLGRQAAIKLPAAEATADPDIRERLLEEARTASSLNHPNICTIYEVGEAEGRVHIVMEYIEGRVLSDVVPSGGLPADTLVRYGIQISDALSHAHQRGIVHRDLKPANVVITPEGRAKVLDFGLAGRLAAYDVEHVTQSRATLAESGPVSGTLPYMAPELLHGKPGDERTDIWSLGVLLFEMAAGGLPFQGNTGFELSCAILREQPAALPAGTPKGLGSVIARCLTKEPVQRYQQGNEVRAALEATLPYLAMAPSAIPGETPIVGRQPMVGGEPIVGREEISGRQPVTVPSGVPGIEPQRVDRPVSGEPRIESIAVLPLVNLSGDPEQEFFVDGMTEALITELARIRALRVVSRTSVMRFKGTTTSLPEVARELGVDAIVEGSVLRADDQVRITAQLLDAATDSHLWADSYDGELRNVLQLQKDVARAIAEEIKVTLSEEEHASLAVARPVDPEAFDAVLRGMFLTEKVTTEALSQGLECFERAIELDAREARAYAGMALNQGMTAFFGEVNAAPVMARAEEAAHKAIELDPTIAETHTALGCVQFCYYWNWPEAEREFQRALELNPSSWWALGYLGWLLLSQGRFEEGIDHFRRSIEINPYSAMPVHELGHALLMAGRPDEAIIELEKALALEPYRWRPHWIMGLAYASKGDLDKAIEEEKRAVEVSGGHVIAELQLATLFALAGDTARTEARLQEILDTGDRRYVPPYFLAHIYLALGDKERALDCLEEAYEERYPYLFTLKVTYRFEALRSDSRYEDLLRRIGFE